MEGETVFKDSGPSSRCQSGRDRPRYARTGGGVVFAGKRGCEVGREVSYCVSEEDEAALLVLCLLSCQGVASRCVALLCLRCFALRVGCVCPVRLFCLFGRLAGRLAGWLLAACLPGCMFGSGCRRTVDPPPSVWQDECSYKTARALQAATASCRLLT